MIKIHLEFFSRETEFLEKKFEIKLPSELVFKVAETNDLRAICVFGFDVTPEIVRYVEEHYPDIAVNFKEFDAQFTGIA